MGTVERLWAYTQQVLDGHVVTKEEALELLTLGKEAPMYLLAGADTIRRRFCGDTMDFCADVNARSGKCSENCKFCAQSGWYHTGVQEYPLRSTADLVGEAKQAEQYGAKRFGIVTSGRDQHDAAQFASIVETVREIKKQTNLKVCCSLGLLTTTQLQQLKEAGVYRIHCNLETSKAYFPKICTTHTWQEKADHIRRIQAAGLDVCSGGIIGLGEDEEDRVDLAMALQERHIMSVPINIFTPIKGTPMAQYPVLQPAEICRTMAMFRYVLPKATIRVCAGREGALRDMQGLAMVSGLNGAMIGGYLTIAGRPPDRDKQLAKDSGRTW